MTGHRDDPQRATMSATGVCPACANHVGFWGVKEEGQECASVYFHPDSHDYHEVIRQDAQLPEPLVRAYASTVDAYNAGNFPAAAVCCGRTLEGIFKHLLPEAERDISLANAIEKAAEHRDFSAPIRELSNVLRRGRNLGAHFDMRTEPDEVVAKAMVELLEYLISYIYILPRRINELERVLSKDR